MSGLALAFWADTEDEARRQAEAWADAEPAWTLARIVSATEGPDRRYWWTVVVDLEPVDELQPTLGLSA